MFVSCGVVVWLMVFVGGFDLRVDSFGFWCLASFGWVWFIWRSVLWVLRVLVVFWFGGFDALCYGMWFVLIAFWFSGRVVVWF